jgi:hypothetical protein
MSPFQRRPNDIFDFHPLKCGDPTIKTPLYIFKKAYYGIGLTKGFKRRKERPINTTK